MITLSVRFEHEFGMEWEGVVHTNVQSTAALHGPDMWDQCEPEGVPADVLAYAALSPGEKKNKNPLSGRSSYCSETVPVW